MGLALLLSALFFASPLAAQGAGGSVTVKGQVLDRSSGRPVAGAQISFPASNRKAVTDEHGNFIVDGVAAGSQAFVVQQAGYVAQRQTLELMPGERLITVRLRQDHAANATRQIRMLGRAA
ncbi:MAG TPA: carboxypeptidase regulatory-like domain-containing protein [Longimicrobiaceae bacterium]|nr:carboxypeptidase regulatory-like domain-containing protein [Longimicrobiaceae bacterium]